MPQKRDMLYLFPCGEIQGLFILWRQFKKEKKCPEHKGFITAGRATKEKMLYYLERSMQKIAFWLTREPGALLFAFLWHILGFLAVLILNSGLTAKVFSYLLTWLKYCPIVFGF